MILENSEVPDYLKPIWRLALDEKIKTDYITLCYEWTFEDMCIAYKALQDYDFIYQAQMNTK